MNLFIVHAVFINEINYVILMSEIKHDVNLIKKSVCFYYASLIVICFKCSLINKFVFA